MDAQQAVVKAEKLIQKWNIDGKLDGWKVVLNNRITRALGRCHFKYKQIELQTRYVLENTEEQITDTILHEIAHALAGAAAGHGYEWKLWAQRVGAKPERTVDSRKINLTRKWEVVVMQNKRGVRVVERTGITADRRSNLQGRMLKGRPDTLNQLVWVEANKGN